MRLRSFWRKKTQMHNKYTENLAELIKQKESEGFEVIKPDPYKLLLDIDSPKLDRFFELWWNTDTLGCSLEDFWKSKSGNWHVVLRSTKKLSPKTRVYYQALLGSDQKRELLSLARIKRRQKNFSVLFKPPNNPKELIIRNRFIKDYENISDLIFNKIETEKGVWLVPKNIPNPGDCVHFDDPKDLNSQGYAGATLNFKLADGSVYSAKGPWHSNTDALFRHSGVDIRDKHLTYVVLAEKREYIHFDTTLLSGVCYKDESPVIGKFDRYKEIAKNYPEAKVYYAESTGGSSCGIIS